MRVEAGEVLRDGGLRVTAQRVAVLRAVSGEPHVTADAVAEKSRSEVDEISVQAVGSAPCLTAVDDMGYQIDEAEVVYWGRCPTCVAAT